MLKTSTILVAGKGLVGSAVTRLLESSGFTNILNPSRIHLDLSRQTQVEAYFSRHRPQYVILAAAKVGGIYANSTYPGDFIRENLVIQQNVIETARQTEVKRLIFLGSSCIYPKFSPQPIREEYLLSSALEETNEAYAIAKIAGIKMCQAYRKQFGFHSISLMPTNLYGPNDNFDRQNSHVLPGLIRRIHESKQDNAPFVEIWGTGTPKREFLYVDDLAGACLFLLDIPMSIIDQFATDGLINVGTGMDISISDLAHLLAEVIGYKGDLKFNPDKPDGTPRKLMDVSRLKAMGWEPRTQLKEGLRKTYQWFINHADRHQTSEINSNHQTALTGLI